MIETLVGGNITRITSFGNFWAVDRKLLTNPRPLERLGLGNWLVNQLHPRPIRLLTGDTHAVWHFRSMRLLVKSLRCPQMKHSFLRFSHHFPRGGVILITLTLSMSMSRFNVSTEKGRRAVIYTVVEICVSRLNGEGGDMMRTVQSGSAPRRMFFLEV